MPNVRPDSQVGFLPVTQLTCPTNLPHSLHQSLIQNLGQILTRKAREFLQDDLLKVLFDGVVAPVDIGGSSNACLRFLLLHIFVDLRGHRNTDLFVFGVDDEIDCLVGGLRLLAAVCCDVDVAFEDERVASWNAPTLHGWFICHDFQSKDERNFRLNDAACALAFI